MTTDHFVPLLKSLRDVDGVIGSFIWTKTGNLLARDLPEPLESGVLCEVGPRLTRLYEAFQNSGDDFELATLVFAQHKLHVRAIEAAFIAVLSAIPISMPTLKMALNLVGRRVTSELEQAPKALSAQARSEPQAGAQPSLWTKIYRGSRVRD